jgi:hypothetical protein
MKRFSLALSFILACLVSCFNSCDQKSSLSHHEIMEKATRTEKNGWILVHVEGSPTVIGYQHGFLLADEIVDLKGALAMLNEQSTGKNWEFYRTESFRLFWSKISEEYQQEIIGITNGVNDKLGNDKVDIKDVVAINANIEMAGYYVPWLEKQEKPVPPEHCSAVAATGSWTTDGKIVMAHNNWSEYVIGERWNIILDIVPEKGNRMVMDALPGMIHSGDDFNINSKGLIVTETTISNFSGFDTTGVPEFVRARQAIQYATSIDEWAAIMIDKNNGGYANDWLIGDNKTGEIARLELGLKNHFLDRTKDGTFYGANFPVYEKLIKEETHFDPASRDLSPNIRRLRWEALMKEYKGKIDIEAAKAFIGDHYDMRRLTEKAGRFSLCGHLDEDSIGTKDMTWDGAFFHAGAVQGKATNSRLAAGMQFWAIMGHPCGQPFYAGKFLEIHPEYKFQKDYLRDMPGQKWLLTDPVIQPK